MEELFETNAVKITMNVEKNIITVVAEIKDEEIFSIPAWENKQVRARLSDMAARQMMNLLSQRIPITNEHKGKMLHVTCPCGYQFEREAPCCGEKYIKCPKCGRRLPVPGKGTQNA
jgi:hypothetical protein